MRKFANSNKVNYGIALALFGILCFSLMSSVEGMTTDKKEKKTPMTKKAHSMTQLMTKTTEGLKEGSKKI
jgi:hypothetical protein